MASHRKNGMNKNYFRVVAASAAAVGVSALTPSVTTAATVSQPSTNELAGVAGLENIPGIQYIPGIDQIIPSLAGQTSSLDKADNANAVVAALLANPQIQSVSGLQNYIATTAAGLGFDGKLPPAPTPAPEQTAAPEQTEAPAPKTDVPSEQAAVPTTPAKKTPALAKADDTQAVSAPVAGSGLGAQIVSIARSRIGSPYSWGAAGPNAFDCSGLVYWTFGQVGMTLPRTSQAMASQGQAVSLDQLQPGDVLTFNGDASHVGIYTGGGMFVDALNEGEPVAERSFSFLQPTGAVRF